MGNVLTPKRIAIFGVMVSLISFSYKLTIAILATSLVLIIASIPTMFIFICKVFFVKNIHQSRANKRKGYLAMAILTALFVMTFLLFSVFKIGGIDITNQNGFEGWITIVFIAFILVMFVLSLINLKGALDRSDLIVKCIREITFAGFDAGDGQIAWMEENDKPLLLGSIAQDSHELGYQAAKQAIEAANGNKVEESITTPGLWWDINNYKDLMERKIVYKG